MRDYSDFDKRYEKNRKENKIGWSNEESYKLHIENLERILKLEGVSSSGKFLELGSGAGNNSIYMAKKGWEVYGIEISPVAVEWAKEKAEKEGVRADFRAGDITYLNGYQDNYFDFVYDGGVSYYICGENRKIFFGNVNRVMKKGAYFFVAAQHGDEKPREKKQKDNFLWEPESGTFLKNNAPWGSFRLSKEILSEVEKSGFKIINSRIEKDQHPGDPFTYGGSLSIDCIKR